MNPKRNFDLEYWKTSPKTCVFYQIFLPADFKGDTKMIICDFCETDIHFYCDPKLRGKICFKDQYYKCPMCSKKRKRGIN